MKFGPRRADELKFEFENLKQLPLLCLLFSSCWLVARPSTSAAKCTSNYIEVVCVCVEKTEQTERMEARKGETERERSDQFNQLTSKVADD